MPIVPDRDPDHGRDAEGARRLLVSAEGAGLARFGLRGGAGRRWADPFTLLPGVGADTAAALAVTELPDFVVSTTDEATARALVAAGGAPDRVARVLQATTSRSWNVHLPPRQRASAPGGAFGDAVTTVLCRLVPGEVTTYGEVAAEAGFPGAARAVGTLLRHSSGVPWWRVVTATGRLAPGKEAEQARLLRAEGVRLRAGSVARS